MNLRKSKQFCAQRFSSKRALRLTSLYFSLALVVSISYGSWVMWGRLYPSLLGIFLGPFLARYWLAWCEEGKVQEIERSAIIFLQTLSGLLDSGICFTDAVFRITRQMPSEFSYLLHHSLLRFEKGKAFAECVSYFRFRHRLRVVGGWFRLLGLSYERGLSIGAMLHEVLPLLKSERAFAEKVRALRKHAFAQAALATLLPWGLVFTGFLGAYSVGGDLSALDGDAVSLFVPPLVFQVVGFWFIGRVATF